MIPSITTHYGGRKFRSRTEARWAVFFDALGIAYDYEAEGYVGRNGAYLPDFWIRDFRMFLEVKGQEPTLVEVEKCEDLVEATGNDVLIAVGGPEERFQLTWVDRDGAKPGLYVLAQDRVVEWGFWLVADEDAVWVGPCRTTVPRGGPMLSGALEAAYVLAGEATFVREHRQRRVAVEPHRPDRTAAHYQDEDAA